MATKKFVVLLMLLAFFSYSAALIAGDKGECWVRSSCTNGWPDPDAECRCGTENSWAIDCIGYVTGPIGQSYLLHADCFWEGSRCDSEDFIEECDVD